MNLRNRPFLFTLLVITLLFLGGNFSGCETEDWIVEVNCNDCFGFKPDSAKLIVYVTIDFEGDSVPLTFYRGDSKGEVDWQDTATTNEFYLDAEVGTTYTVMAEYRSGPTNIIAYDSDKMTLSYYGDDCGYTCYIIKGGTFDLRLTGD